MIATAGGFAGFLSPDVPYGRRARQVAAMGVGLALAMAAGTLAAGSASAVALVSGAVAGVAAYVCMANELPPPREFFVVLTCLLATGLPLDHGAAAERAGLVLAGAALAWVIAMSGALVAPRAPEQTMVRRAYGRVARLLEALGTDAVDEAQHEAVMAVRAAHIAVRGAGRRRDAAFARLRHRTIALEGLLEGALSLAIEGSRGVDPRFAATVAALGDVDAPRADVPADLEGAPRLLRALRAAAEDDEEEEASPFVPRSWRDALVEAAGPQSLVPATAARMAVAVAAGVGIGSAIGIEHAYWIGLTAASVLQATNVSRALQRATHRAAGTLVGVVLAAAILAPDPGIAALIVAIAVCQFVAEAVIAGSYGLAVVFITPIPLMLFDAATSGAPVGALLGARLLDTLLGCVVALVAGIAWRRASGARLPAAQAAAIDAAGAVLARGLRHPADRASSETRRRRRTLRTALMNLREVQRDAIGDVVLRESAADARWPATVSIQRIAYLAMSLPPPGLDAAVVPQLERAVADLARLAAGSAPAEPARVPPLPGYPRTERELAALRDALTAPRSAAAAP